MALLADIAVQLNRTKVLLERQSQLSIPSTKGCVLVCNADNLGTCQKVCQPVSNIDDLSGTMLAKFPTDAKLLETHPDVLQDLHNVRDANIEQLTPEKVRYVLTLPSSFVLLDDTQWTSAYNALPEKEQRMVQSILKARVQHIPTEYHSIVKRRLS